MNIYELTNHNIMACAEAVFKQIPFSYIGSPAKIKLTKRLIELKLLWWHTYMEQEYKNRKGVKS